MDVLLDTNILVRLANKADAMHSIANQAVATLHRRGESIRITPQNLVEFRNVATRAHSLNGLGLSATDAEIRSTAFESQFALLPDTPDIHPQWKFLVASLGIIGKQVHDARLVAVCHVHGVSQVLTFNEAHFVRFANFGPGLVVLHPSRV